MSFVHKQAKRKMDSRDTCRVVFIRPSISLWCTGALLPGSASSGIIVTELAVMFRVLVTSLLYTGGSDWNTGKLPAVKRMPLTLGRGFRGLSAFFLVAPVI